jgi:hypothetical protein
MLDTCVASRLPPGEVKKAAFLWSSSWLTVGFCARNALHSEWSDGFDMSVIRISMSLNNLVKNKSLVAVSSEGV